MEKEYSDKEWKNLSDEERFQFLFPGTQKRIQEKEEETILRNNKKFEGFLQQVLNSIPDEWKFEICVIQEEETILLRIDSGLVWEMNNPDFFQHQIHDCIKVLEQEKSLRDYESFEEMFSSLYERSMDLEELEYSLIDQLDNWSF
jgi:hypothetical protein